MISYKPEIRILANPGLAYSGFEQPGPEQQCGTCLKHSSSKWGTSQKNDCD